VISRSGGRIGDIWWMGRIGDIRWMGRIGDIWWKGRIGDIAVRRDRASLFIFDHQSGSDCFEHGGNVRWLSHR